MAPKSTKREGDGQYIRVLSHFWDKKVHLAQSGSETQLFLNAVKGQCWVSLAFNPTYSTICELFLVYCCTVVIFCGAYGFMDGQGQPGSLCSKTIIGEGRRVCDDNGDEINRTR